MKGEKDRIDRLLDRNAAEQLARINWDRLTDEISARLDQARRVKVARSGWPAFFKIAAGVAAAAIIVVVVVTKRTRAPSDVHVPEGRSAVVEFVDRPGGASIQIDKTAGKALVVVHGGRDDRKVATCVVDIIERNGDLKRASSRAAWIIVSQPQRTLAENGQSKDETDVLCML
jgi:hypothetical protein